MLIYRDHTRQLDRSSLVWLPRASGRLSSWVVELFILHQKHIFAVHPEPVSWGLADLTVFFLGVAYILPWLGLDAHHSPCEAEILTTYLDHLLFALCFCWKHFHSYKPGSSFGSRLEHHHLWEGDTSMSPSPSPVSESLFVPFTALPQAVTKVLSGCSV